MRWINKIIVHCSDSPAGRNDKAADLDLWHKEKGWKKIGYHYVVYLDGSIHKGRNEEVVGAHCEGHNAHSIGVCYIGGKEAGTFRAKDTRTPAQKEALIRLLMKLVCKYPDAEIVGHRDLANRKCPCFDAKNEYRNI